MEIKIGDNYTLEVILAPVKLAANWYHIAIWYSEEGNALSKGEIFLHWLDNKSYKRDGDKVYCAVNVLMENYDKSSMMRSIRIWADKKIAEHQYLLSGGNES